MKIAKKLIHFSLVIFLFYSSFSEASFNAIVRINDAKIYSDPTLKIPIGVLERGKKIKIAEKLKKNGQVAVLEVSNKLAFIKAEDLLIENEKDPFVHFTKQGRNYSLEGIEEPPTVKELFDDSGFSTHYQLISLSDNLEKYYSYSNTKHANLVDFNIEYMWRNSLGLSAGFYYLFVGDNNMVVDSIGPTFSAIYQLFNSKVINMTVHSSLLLSPYTNAKIDSTNFSGQAFGARAGGNFNLTFGPHFEMRLGGGFFYYQTTKLGHTYSIGEAKVEQKLPSLITKSTYFSAGLAYFF